MGCIPSKLKKHHLSARRDPPPPVPLEADHGAGTASSSGFIAKSDHHRAGEQKKANIVAPSGIINGPPADHHQKKKKDKANIDVPSPVVDIEQDAGSHNLKIYIIYYSVYGHEEALAKKVKEGVDSIDGLEGHLFRVPELLMQTKSKNTICAAEGDEEEEEEVKVEGTMNNGFAKDERIPTITADDMVKADGFMFGFPTQFGTMAAQMKAFLDSTVSLWKGQQLAGKPAGVFVSTPSQGGGQEATVWTCISQLSHHGMLYVPIGYTFGAGMFKMDEIRGGSPFGAGTYTLDDGTRSPSDTELALAEHQGKYIAGLVKKLRSC